MHAYVGYRPAGDLRVRASARFDGPGRVGVRNDGKNCPEGREFAFDLFLTNRYDFIVYAAKCLFRQDFEYVQSIKLKNVRLFAYR